MEKASTREIAPRLATETVLSRTAALSPIGASSSARSALVALVATAAGMVCPMADMSRLPSHPSGVYHHYRRRILAPRRQAAPYAVRPADDKWHWPLPLVACRG